MRAHAGLLPLTLFVTSGCASSPTDGAGAGGASSVAPQVASLGQSATAHGSLSALRERFRVTPMARPDRPGRPPAPASVAVIGRGVATSFEPTGTGGVRAVVPREAKRAVLRAASVELPLRANAMARVEDDVTHVCVGFALRDAGDAELTVANGMARYAGALRGSDVVHRVHAEGTEDFVVFETRPAREELVYDVDVSRVAGLRLVSNTLEFLDEGGAPRLRVAPPYVVDASGKRSEARIAVDGCAYDTDASGPWGRPVTKAGAARCGVRVKWSGVGYPLIVDPSWTATGSMATKRNDHTATLLASGKVLVAGGYNGGYVSSAELFDESGSFAATGSMTTTRGVHTATLLPSGKVLLAGGYAEPNGTYLASAELFDGSGAFAATGAMKSKRIAHTATLLPSGQVLVAGGYTTAPGYHLWSAELFDGSASFTETGAMNGWRAEHSATLLASGKVLVAGGAGASGTLASAELFDGSGTFTAIGSMKAERRLPMAMLLPSGKVLVAGGTNQIGEFFSSAELFDGIGTFAPTASMTTARFLQTATLLASGKVLVAGGSYKFGAQATAELFDGVASFAPTASMTTARFGHTATRLASGRVLIVGGFDDLENLSSAELFALPIGAPCAGADDCGSALCNERCCSSACAGECKTCDAKGACLPVKSADDADTCSQALNQSACDASALCKKLQGQACTVGGDCVAGFCADGFCCDSACGGACEVCAASLGATLDGTCGPATLGYAGSPACGKGYACNGKSAACPASCASDLDCVAADYCAADGTCQTRKKQGSACSAAAGADCKAASCRVCDTSFCVDGFCCDTACNTTCQACAASLKQSGAADGICGNAREQTNPHGDACPKSPEAECGFDGQCNALGGCGALWLAGTACGDSDCDGNRAAGMTCNGAGICGFDPIGTDCEDYVCVGGSCPKTCAADANCVPTAYCKAGACLPKRPNGASCAELKECAKGRCVDSVCCNAACAGQCEACDAQGTEGTCTPVVGSPHGGRSPCASGGANLCAAASCDGVEPSSCQALVGSSLPCREAGCVDGMQTLPAKCNGNGTCPDLVTKLCAPYLCGHDTCKTSCDGDADCVERNHCVEKVCVSVATCGTDGHTATGADGTTMDCAPFNCDSTGACRIQCGSIDDCSSPNVCDSARHCVAPAASGGDSGGCAVTALPRDSSPSRTPALLFALGLAALASRRRDGRA